MTGDIVDFRQPAAAATVPKSKVEVTPEDPQNCGDRKFWAELLALKIMVLHLVKDECERSADAIARLTEMRHSAQVQLVRATFNDSTPAEAADCRARAEVALRELFGCLRV